MREVWIISAARTPVGSFNGALGAVPATKLGSAAIAEALRRAGVGASEVDEVIMGNVLAAGLGQAPARQAGFGAGLPKEVGALTINKMCGSGLKAVMLAAQAIICGDADIIAAGGMENMSRAPYLMDGARSGYRMGHGKLVDSMIQDGLWDVYNDFHMGNAAELCAEKYKIGRREQDEFAAESYRRAIRSQNEGLFASELVSVEVPQAKGQALKVSEDEEPKRVNFDKIPALKPAFKKEGTVTAANASKINDGAAALVVAEAARATKLGLKPLARIIGQATASLEPGWFTIAPVYAIEKLLAKTGHKIDEVELFEINEAFAVVALACTALLGIDRDRVNVNGGAVALGHPIGASGARILTTLLYAMKHKKAKKGIAAICIGGGEASAVLVEMIS